MNMDYQSTDGGGHNTDWIPVSQAAKLLGKTDRTIRRYASGEFKAPVGLEFKTEDRRIMVKISHFHQKEEKKSGREDATESMKTLIREKDSEISRLQIVLHTKEEVLKVKDEQIEDLRRNREASTETIKALQISLIQLQQSLPAPKGVYTQETGETAVEGRRGRLRLFLLIGLIALLVVGVMVWYVNWYVHI